MLKELLDKRTNDYLEMTKQIVEHYQDNLIRAIRFFTKTDKDIRITSVYLYPTNPSFIVNVCKVYMSVGDSIRTPNGDIVIVTEENINKLVTNDLQIVLPSKVLEKCNALQMYEQIVAIDNFVKSYGMEKLAKLIASGITGLDDLMEEKYEILLDQITDPTNDIVEKLDDLQKVQYNIFLNDTDRKIH